MAWMEKPRRATARRTTHSKIIIIKVGEWAGSLGILWGAAGGVGLGMVRFRTVSVSTVNYKLTLQATRGQRGTAPCPHLSLPLTFSLSNPTLWFFVCTHTLYICVCVCVSWWCPFHVRTKNAARGKTDRNTEKREAKKANKDSRHKGDETRKRRSGEWLRSSGHSQVV